MKKLLLLIVLIAILVVCVTACNATVTLKDIEWRYADKSFFITPNRDIENAAIEYILKNEAGEVVETKTKPIGNLRSGQVYKIEAVPLTLIFDNVKSGEIVKIQGKI